MMFSKALGIASAVAGALGTALLYRGSFAYESFTPYTNPNLVEEMKRRNVKRRRFQQAGLLLLMVSFALAGISVAVSP